MGDDIYFLRKKTILVYVLARKKPLIITYSKTSSAIDHISIRFVLHRRLETDNQKRNSPHRVSNLCYITLKRITLTDISKNTFVWVSKEAS